MGLYVMRPRIVSRRSNKPAHIKEKRRPNRLPALPAGLGNAALSMGTAFFFVF
jgi:hypothetical protein